MIGSVMGIRLDRMAFCEECGSVCDRACRMQGVEDRRRLDEALVRAMGALR